MTGVVEVAGPAGVADAPGSGAAGAPHEHFVGHARELALVTDACRAAAGGRGTVVVVSGEAGVGKSRLCAEAGARLAARMTVVTARCWPHGGAPALWPWQPILRDLAGPDAAALLAAGPAPGDVSAGGTPAAVLDPDRFARFVAVAERLAAAARVRPACVVIDDAHAAEAATLLLARFVARSTGGLALVLARRPGEAAGPEEARLLGEIESEATSVVVGGLTPDETAAFLAAHGVGGGAAAGAGGGEGLVAAVHRVTGGNPLFLRRVAAAGAERPAGAAGDVPGGLRAVIEEALARLPAASQHVLQVAAVLGDRPAVAEVALVAGTEPAAVLDTVADGAAAGLVGPAAPAAGGRGLGDRGGRPPQVVFTHEVVRSTVAARLPAAARLDAHARAVPVVGAYATGSPDGLARRAHHALAAAPRSPADARIAVAACRDAARAAVAGFAYERADALLTAAVDLHEPGGIGPPPGRLLVEWAQAALAAGRLGEARARFDRAATATAAEDDPVGLAEAALGLGGHWVNEHRSPVERARVLGLQRAALDGLPRGEDALRCRLRARLAAEATYDGAPFGPVQEALDAARACGDATARAEALSLAHHALLAPEHARSRLALADELVRVASEAGHGPLALMGLCWRAVDLFLLGDPRAGRALEALRQRLDALPCGNIAYIVEALDVMLLVRAGRFDEAEAAARRCQELGTEVGELDTLGYLGAHLLGIRWAQGRDAELLDLAEEVAASPTLVAPEFAFRATAAAIAARDGQHDRARAALAPLVAGGLAALPRSSTWLVGMLALVEAAAVLGDADVARQAHDLLVPYAELPAMASLAVVCLGSSERAVGLAAATLGDLDAAADRLGRAVAAQRAPRQPPARRHRPRRPGPGAGPAGRAGRPGPGGGPAPGRRRRRRHAGHDRPRSRLASRPGRPRAAHPTPAGRRCGRARGRVPRARVGRVAPHGRGWLVVLGDRRAHVPDLVGMRYLAVLLAGPGPADRRPDAGGRGRAAPRGPRHDVLDPTARAAYAARVRELDAEVAEAESGHDLARAERLRAERDAVVEQLAAATGLAGRPRAFVDDAERARHGGPQVAQAGDRPAGGGRRAHRRPPARRRSRPARPASTPRRRATR